MSKDKQIEEMEIALHEAQHEYDKAWHECLHNGGKRPERENVFYAKYLIESKGYRKSTELAEEIFAEIDDFQRTLRHIFLGMCGGNDYNTLNLLQIDNAIEALFDSRIAELKKKYTESEKD